MRTATLVAGVLILGTVLWDAFETIVLPRTAMRKLRLARVYYRISWHGWMTIGRVLRSDARRERYLAIYGPLSSSACSPSGRLDSSRRSRWCDGLRIRCRSSTRCTEARRRSSRWDPARA